MNKKVMLSFLLCLVLVTGLVFAQNNNSDSQISDADVYSDIGDVEIQESAGLTPDDTFYFIDEFFESILIGDNPERALAYKEEKILEIKQMIEEGKIEEAKEILEKISEYSDILEREVSPEIEKRARESSKAVKEVLKDLRKDLEGDEWKDVRDEMNKHDKREDKIALAAKISSKINSLCEDLAKLDPLEYSRVCRTGDDSPKWRRDLDEKLTEEQVVEAEEFFEIMSECFQNPSVCRCDDISVSAFAQKCNIIAPLAAACDAGDEDACEDMEDAEDPIDVLPDYLQDVMEDVEERFGEAKYDLHVPEECREAGALDRKSCGKIMFREHAPEECVEAMERGEIDVGNERKAREACDKIMFKVNAPQECIDEGIKNHKECGKFMFKLHAPQECINAGLTGESKRDMRDCEELVGSRFGDDKGRGGPRDMVSSGASCMRIKGAIERLDCFEKSINGAGERFERREFEDGEGELTWQCKENRIHWPPDCKRFMDEEWPEMERRKREGRDDFEDRFKEIKERERECADKCNSEGRAWDFYNGECECYEGDYVGGYSCDTMYCGPGTHCEPDYGCVSDDGDPSIGFSECKDGCSQECPGADRTDCINDRCECLYGDKFDLSYEESECKDECSQECPGADRTDCVDGGRRCECYYESEDSSSGSEYSGSGLVDGGESGSSEGSGDSTVDDQTVTSDSNSGSSDDSDSGSDDDSNSGSSDGGSDDGDDSGESSNDGSGITGGVVRNEFINNYFD